MRLTALVSGTVQGVGYRQYVQRRARDLHLHGYAENLLDGRVEVVAEGEEADLTRLLHWIGRGPARPRGRGADPVRRGDRPEGLPHLLRGTGLGV